MTHRGHKTESKQKALPLGVLEKAWDKNTRPPNLLVLHCPHPQSPRASALLPMVSLPMPPPSCKHSGLHGPSDSPACLSELLDGPPIKEDTVMLLKRNDCPSTPEEAKLSPALIFTKEFRAVGSLRKELHDLMHGTSKTSLQ